MRPVVVLLAPFPGLATKTLLSLARLYGAKIEESAGSMKLALKNRLKTGFPLKKEEKTAKKPLTASPISLTITIRSDS
jgi:hypothetical protein